MPTNPIATCKFHIARCGREEAIAKSWPDGQKPDSRQVKGTSWPRTVNPKGNMTFICKSGG
ncbi:MAG: hypothetical protein CVV46_15345 [Spirochaetae bacterium HGW-Spirochaetae-2]|nr:MAG: hypothetical protein CVV46_15345 [Spirochaetae bacterium HGW-Spirochaetae-2]